MSLSVKALIDSYAERNVIQESDNSDSVIDSDDNEISINEINDKMVAALSMGVIIEKALAERRANRF